MIFPYPYNYLFSSDMILYRENSKDSTKKTPKPQICYLNEFCKVAGYKINTQTQFLYTNKNYLERGFFSSKSFVSIWWAPGWLKTCLEVAGRGSGKALILGRCRGAPQRLLSFGGLLIGPLERILCPSQPRGCQPCY